MQRTWQQIMATPYTGLRELGHNELTDCYWAQPPLKKGLLTFSLASLCKNTQHYSSLRHLHVFCFTIIPRPTHPAPCVVQWPWPLWCWHWNIPEELGQYLGCWCPGFLCHQPISSHGIDYTGPCLPPGKISTTCISLVLRNHRNMIYGN